MGTMTRTSAERAVARELRRLKAVHRERLGQLSAAAQVERLASLTVRFNELDAAIRAAGGVSERTAPMVGELTKLADSILELEAYLRGAMEETDWETRQ